MILAGVGAVPGARLGGPAAPVAVAGMLLLGLACVALSLLLRITRRAERAADHLMRFETDSDRRQAVAIEELRDDVDRLRSDLARLVARLQISAPSRRDQAEAQVGPPTCRSSAADLSSGAKENDRDA